MREFCLGSLCASLFGIVFFLGGIQVQLKGIREELHSSRVVPLEDVNQEQACECNDD